jgi:hypothetical protein
MITLIYITIKILIWTWYVKFEFDMLIVWHKMGIIKPPILIKSLSNMLKIIDFMFICSLEMGVIAPEVTRMI